MINSKHYILTIILIIVFCIFISNSHTLTCDDNLDYYNLDNDLSYLLTDEEKYTPEYKNLNIPRKIYHTIPDKNNCHPDILKNMKIIKNLNSNWEQKIFDNKDQKEYIEKYFPDKLKYYNQINPKAGASRADLFRYLLMYKEGGVYMDCKSFCNIPFETVIDEDDDIIIVFDNSTHNPMKYFSKDLGEIAQWIIIVPPKSPFIKQVIQNIVKRFENKQRVYEIIDYTQQKLPKWPRLALEIFEFTGPGVYTRTFLKYKDKFKKIKKFPIGHIFKRVVVKNYEEKNYNGKHNHYVQMKNARLFEEDSFR